MTLLRALPPLALLLACWMFAHAIPPAVYDVTTMSISSVKCAAWGMAWGVIVGMLVAGTVGAWRERR